MGPNCWRGHRGLRARNTQTGKSIAQRSRRSQRGELGWGQIAGGTPRPAREKYANRESIAQRSRRSQRGNENWGGESDSGDATAGVSPCNVNPSHRFSFGLIHAPQPRTPHFRTFPVLRCQPSTLGLLAQRPRCSRSSLAPSQSSLVASVRCSLRGVVFLVRRPPRPVDSLGVNPNPPSVTSVRCSPLSCTKPAAPLNVALLTETLSLDFRGCLA
jgi:hypothetical protein